MYWVMSAAQALSQPASPAVGMPVTDLVTRAHPAMWQTSMPSRGEVGLLVAPNVGGGGAEVGADPGDRSAEVFGGLGMSASAGGGVLVQGAPPASRQLAWLSW